MQLWQTGASAARTAWLTPPRTDHRSDACAYILMPRDCFFGGSG